MKNHFVFFMAMLYLILRVPAAQAEFVEPHHWQLGSREWVSISSEVLTPGIPVMYFQDKQNPDLKITYTRIELTSEDACFVKSTCSTVGSEMQNREALSRSDFVAKGLMGCQIQYQQNGIATAKLNIFQSRVKNGRRICSIDNFLWQGEQKALLNKQSDLTNFFNKIRSAVEKENGL